MLSLFRAAVISPVVAAITVLLVPIPSAYATGSVTVDNAGRGAVIDGTYSSSLRVSGRGFQSIKGGHGGVYVWFGTVRSGWQPSKGGKSGSDYVYVPDSESKSNAGFQQFIAFPGSDTASSAAATMTQSGDWRAHITVPGPTFQGVGRDGTVEAVDCRKVVCGVITVGAHGVPNANNETFTPVRVAAASESSAQQSDIPAAAPPATAAQSGTTAATRASASTRTPRDRTAGAVQLPTRPRGPAVLTVDRSAAKAGYALSWTARNLVPGRQFTVVLDDGVAASGPHTAGADGRASGVLRLPGDLVAGTAQLRLHGAGRAAQVRFGVVASPDLAAAAQRASEPGPSWPPVAFAVAAALAFVAALTIAIRRRAGGGARA